MGRTIEYKTTTICNQSHTIKYQLPGEDLDALVFVSFDEDLQNMEEYHRLKSILQASLNHEYIIAINGLLDPSPQKNSIVQLVIGKVNMSGSSKELVPPVIFSYHNQIDGGFIDMPMLGDRTMHSDRHLLQIDEQGIMMGFAGSTTFHNTMVHAFSNSHLQQYGER
ncbi:hypothetical protein Ancab_021292 [Ancistrocladus abbreviatus]